MRNFLNNKKSIRQKTIKEESIYLKTIIKGVANNKWAAGKKE